MTRTTLLLVLPLLLAACGDDHTEGVSTATVADPVTAPPLPPAATTTTLAIAREGSSVGFTGAKLTGSHTGTFNDFSG